MSVEYTQKFLLRLPDKFKKLFPNPQESSRGPNIFQLNLKPKIDAKAMVINPGEPGHVPGKKNEQANAV